MTDLSKPWPFGLSRQTALGFALALIVVLAVLSVFDPDISNYGRGQPPEVVAFFATVTRYGESDWILLPALLLFAVSGLLFYLLPKRMLKLALLQNAQIFAFIFVGVGLPGLVASLLKRIIGRGRPQVFETFGQYNFVPFFNDFANQAFPSGHTTTGMALAMVIGFLAPRYFPVSLALGVAIGLSRLVVGAHSISDILAGAVLGTLGAYVVRNFFAKRRWVFEHGSDGIAMRPNAAIRRLLRPRQRPAR